MPRPRLTSILALTITLQLLPVEALANSVLDHCSLNGITVSADVLVGYNGIGSTIPADYSSASDTRPPIVPPTATDTALASTAVLPAGGGSAKDKIDGTMRSRFEFGIPIGSVGQDTVTLEAAGIASAQNSLNAAGNAAAAEISGEARAEFFIDIVPGLDCDTFLELPEVRLLEPYETLLEINVIMDPNGAAVSLGTFGPGSPSQTINLPEDHAYLIQLNYDMLVPFGVDPPFSFTLPITIGPSPAAVPTLEAIPTIGGALLVLATGLFWLHRGGHATSAA